MTTNDQPMTLDEKIDAMRGMLNGVNTTVQDIRASQDESAVRFERFMEVQIGINAELMNMGKRAEQWMKDHEQRMEDHNLRMGNEPGSPDQQESPVEDSQ